MIRPDPRTRHEPPCAAPAGSARRRGLAWALAMGVVALAWGCGGHVMPEIHSDTDRLAAARRFYERRAYIDAVELLKSYIDSAQGSARVDEAIYLLGACYLKQREWALAVDQFDRIARDYPESDSSGSAAFQLGEAYFGQSRKADFDQEYTHRALEQWERYLRGYPGHWLNAEAERKVLDARLRLAEKLIGTGDLYVKLGFLEPARVYYRKVIADYGDTSFRPWAELGEARVDAKEGKRAEAIAGLREIESRYSHLPVAKEAARTRHRLERK